jgi:hypothetical protein
MSAQSQPTLTRRIMGALRGTGWAAGAIAIMLIVVYITIAAFIGAYYLKNWLWPLLAPFHTAISWVVGGVILCAMGFYTFRWLISLEKRAFKKRAFGREWREWASYVGRGKAHAARNAPTQEHATKLSHKPRNAAIHPVIYVVGGYLLLNVALAYLSFATGTGIYAFCQYVSAPSTSFWMKVFSYSFAASVFNTFAIVLYSWLIFQGWNIIALLNQDYGRAMRLPEGDDDTRLAIAAGALAVVAMVVGWALDPFDTWLSIASIPLLAFIPGAALIGWFRGCHKVPANN